MKEVLCALVAAVQGYLLGSLSFAVIVSRLLDGDDVRNHGSGNAGMTNILRTYGKKQAALVCVGDFGKGALAVLLARLLFNSAGITFMDGGYIGGLFVLMGHLFPLYFGFRGGKGVLTSAGIILVLNPVVFVCLIPPIVIFIFITKIVSLGSLLAAVLYPIVTYAVLSLQHRLATFDILFSVFIAILVVWMHRENIKRLLNGTEHRFGQKKQESGGDAESSQGKDGNHV